MRIIVFGLLLSIVILNWLWPLPLPVAVKFLVSAFVIIASQYQLWSRLSSGSVFAPEFPRPLIILFNWAVGTILFLTLFQLALDLGTLVVALIAWQPVFIGTSARVAVGALAGLLAAVGVANALRVPHVRDVTVTIGGLSPLFDGYRLLQLSDLHITRLFSAKWASRVVARANAASADLMVVTGDFIDGSVDMRRSDIAPLAALRAPDGVLAAPGNHEYFFDYAAWIRHLSGLGVDMLENQHRIITRGAARRDGLLSPPTRSGRTGFRYRAGRRAA